jgi:hypothetical protein
MGRLTFWVAVGLVLGSAGAGVAGEPWEIKTTGGYLSGAAVVQNAAAAQQFREQPRAGLQRFLSYDKEGKDPVVGRGASDLWEFVPQGAEGYVIRAAEGKWKGWYLTTSDRAFKDGPSFGFLLELGKEPQTFSVFQVAK